MIYEVNFGDRVLKYGPLVENSNFSKDEWRAIYAEIVRQNEPEIFEKRRNDGEFINILGFSIDIEQRYEALLELLPQHSYSKVGTHPRWVAEAVENNTLNKGITQDDVTMFIKASVEYEELSKELIDYFDLGLTFQTEENR